MTLDTEVEDHVSSVDDQFSEGRVQELSKGHAFALALSVTGLMLPYALPTLIRKGWLKNDDSKYDCSSPSLIGPIFTGSFSGLALTGGQVAGWTVATLNYGPKCLIPLALGNGISFAYELYRFCRK